ncbi:MAG: hypothetical protein AAF541_06680 [Pseudomonadota bacterium]
MKFSKIAGAILLATIIAVAALAPVGPLPGFFIGGTPTVPPNVWPDTSKVDNVTLKIAGGIPRVIIVWIIQYDGELHVIGRSSSSWTNKLGSGGPVELRIEDQTYSLVASRVREGWEPIAMAYMDKYRPDSPELIASFPPIEDAADFIAVFELNRQ